MPETVRPARSRPHAEPKACNLGAAPSVKLQVGRLRVTAQDHVSSACSAALSTSDAAAVGSFFSRGGELEETAVFDQLCPTVMTALELAHRVDRHEVYAIKFRCGNHRTGETAERWPQILARTLAVPGQAHGRGPAVPRRRPLPPWPRTQIQLIIAEVDDPRPTAVTGDEIGLGPWSCSLSEFIGTGSRPTRSRLRSRSVSSVSL